MEIIDFNKNNKKKGFFGVMTPDGKFSMHCNTEDTNFTEIAVLFAFHKQIGKYLNQRINYLLKNQGVNKNV